MKNQIKYEYFGRPLGTFAALLNLENKIEDSDTLAKRVSVWEMKLFYYGCSSATRGLGWVSRDGHAAKGPRTKTSLMHGCPASLPPVQVHTVWKSEIFLRSYFSDQNLKSQHENSLWTEWRLNFRTNNDLSKWHYLAQRFKISSLQSEFSCLNYGFWCEN